MSQRGIELELPDLPEVPISLGQLPREHPSHGRSLSVRVWDALTAGLPLLLMGALALGTWWLVKNAPVPAVSESPRVPRGTPDYTMSGLTLQRFGADGQLQLQIQGQALRHLPREERIEIDDALITAIDANGRHMRARATRVEALDDGSEIRLSGQARVLGTTAKGEPTEIVSEALRLLPQVHRVMGDQSVTIRLGSHELTAGGIEADQRSGVITLLPPVRGTFIPQSAP